MPGPTVTARPFRVHAGAVELAGEDRGAGPAVLLLHGLTATRRYVVHGAGTLPKAGYRVISYDARGHGESSDAPEYSYDSLVSDAVTVLDELGIERAAVAGQSMGAATAAALALRHAERVAALALITPAHEGRPARRPDYWDRLADGFQEGGVEGFLAALGPFSMPERWRDAARTVIRQRMERHLHPDAVAEALRAVQRTSAFDGLDALRGIAAPTLVVGSRDEVDADHPLAMAEEYAARIPRATLVVEKLGESPLAWRGGAVSRELLDFFQRSGWPPEPA